MTGARIIGQHRGIPVSVSPIVEEGKVYQMRGFGIVLREGSKEADKIEFGDDWIWGPIYRAQRDMDRLQARAMKTIEDAWIKADLRVIGLMLGVPMADTDEILNSARRRTGRM